MFSYFMFGIGHFQCENGPFVLVSMGHLKFRGLIPQAASLGISLVLVDSMISISGCTLVYPYRCGKGLLKTLNIE